MIVLFWAFCAVVVFLTAYGLYRQVCYDGLGPEEVETARREAEIVVERAAEGVISSLDPEFAAELGLPGAVVRRKFLTGAFSARIGAAAAVSGPLWAFPRPKEAEYTICGARDESRGVVCVRAIQHPGPHAGHLYGPAVSDELWHFPSPGSGPLGPH